MAATPFTLAPPPNYSTPKHFLTQKPPRINLKLTENLKPRRISSQPTSISWSKSGQRSRKLPSRITGHAYVLGAFDAIVPENEPRIEESEVVELRPIYLISWGLLLNLVLRHKWRVLASVITLLGGTPCPILTVSFC